MGKKSVAAALLFTATISGVMSRELQGQIVELDDTSVTLKYKKPRSSKFLNEQLSLSKVLAVYGDLEVGQDVLVSLRPEHGEYDVQKDVAVENLGNGFLKLTNEEGDVVVVAETAVALVGEADDEAPAKKKAAAPAKKTKAKAKDEEEEEEDEEEEEEDEEEAPAKKKAAAKAKPAAKKGKAKDDEDEEEEDEEEEDEEDEEEAPKGKKGAAKKPAAKKGKAKDADDDWDDE